MPGSVNDLKAAVSPVSKQDWACVRPGETALSLPRVQLQENHIAGSELSSNAFMF